MRISRWLGSLSLSLIPFLLPPPLLAQPDAQAVRELEERVTQLKKEVYEAKTQLRQLEEAILEGKITGSKALIVFDNQAEGFFTLATAEFSLDGKPIFSLNAEDKKGGVETITVYDGDIPAGDHVIEAILEYRGSNKSVYQVFPYFKDHKFLLKQSDDFTVDYGKTTQVRLTAMDRGYFEKEFQERLVLQVETIPDWGREPPE